MELCQIKIHISRSFSRCQFYDSAKGCQPRSYASGREGGRAGTPQTTNKQTYVEEVSLDNFIHLCH